MENPNAVYSLNPTQYEMPYEDYVNFEKTYGKFNEDHSVYTVIDRNTPRQWFNFLVNDNFVSVVANDGAALAAYKTFDARLLKYSHISGDYLLRNMTSRRKVIIKNLKTNTVYDLLKDCENMQFIVKPGEVTYKGKMDETEFSVNIFVPNDKACELWDISLASKDNKEYEFTVGLEIALGYQKPWSVPIYPDWDTVIEDNSYYANCGEFLKNTSISAVFAMTGGNVSTRKIESKGLDGRINPHTEVYITKNISLSSNAENSYVIFGVGDTFEESKKLNEYFSDVGNILSEKKKVIEKWKNIIGSNSCEIPDKNMQGFFNVWLKNQIYLTLRYNRFHMMGYRDVFQDTWGHLLLKPDDCKAYILEALSYMYDNGLCPRQYDKFSGMIDSDDYMDSPTWIPYTVCDYIKETGDFALLDEVIPYYNSEKTGTVLEHILLSLDALYNLRGKNGLLLMRDGDWLDGLKGINKFGEATTVWGTMAAYNAQNLMAELLERIGQNDKAVFLRKRSAEYKEIVNTVGWDGNWYVYAFIDDEPIGSHKCHEGKIYINPQSWAIFTGICDDKKRIEKIYRSISIYLDTMYGPQLLAPAYTKYGKKCGRLQKQRPGTFANSAIYLHGAAFKAIADCTVENYDGALDLLSRIFPGHYDNCDSRRTSEPYSIGNVYFGVVHPCHGMNLYSWFTATPAWLIQCGFKHLLGVSAEYDGLRIQPHEISNWNEYSVNKFYRGTMYKINFKKGENKGIFVDGEKIEGNIVKSESRNCVIKVIY